MDWKAVAEDRAQALDNANRKIKHLQDELAKRAEEGPNSAAFTQAKKCYKDTLTNLVKTEESLLRERQKVVGLESRLSKKEEQLQQAQATRATDQSVTAQERKLQDNIKKLENDLAALKTANEGLKSARESLALQLQVEKDENAKYLGFTSAKPGGYDQDDEEVLSR